jgi:hypothetical protein
MATKRFESDVTWNYKYDADVTIGELHESRLPRIILTILVTFLIGAAAAGFYFKDALYDIIVKPEIILKESEITLEVNSKFVPEDYVARLPGNGEQPDRYEIIYPDNGSIDTTKVGDYSVPYKVITKRDNKEHVTRLLVHVVDTTPPVIVISKDEEELTREVDKFRCQSYIVSVKDNYDKTVKATCSDVIDWDADKFEVKYYAEDLSGNLAVKTLTIRFKDKPAPSYVCWDGSLVWTASECPIRPASSGGGGGTSSSDGGNSSSTSSGGGGGTSQPTYVEPDPEPPYIHAPSSCSMQVDGDLDALLACLSNVDSNVRVSVDYSTVNYTVPGTYTVYYNGDGASATTTVYITE